MDQCILDYVNLFTLPSNSTSKVVLFPQGQFFPGRWSYCSSTLERGDRRDMFCEVQDPLGRVYNKSRKPSDFKDSKEQQVKKLDSIQEKNPTCLTAEWALYLKLHSTIKSFCIIY